MSEVFLSVLIAVKNCRENLGMTLQSILGQSYEDIEVVVADDGAEPEISLLIDNYTDEDERIRVCETGRESLPQMRNACLRLARGKFIMFVDPGTQILDEAFRALHRLAVTKGGDILCGGAETITSTGVHHHKMRQERYKGREIIAEDDPVLLHDLEIQNKWIRRAFIEQNGLRFGDFGQMSEVAFLLSAITDARVIRPCDARICRLEGRLLQLSGAAAPIDAGALDAASLRGCINAFSLVCRMTASHGDEYVEELAGLFLQKILIDVYYRHLWILEPACEELLVSYLNKLFTVLSPERQERIERHNADLFCQEGFRSTEKLLDMTLVTVAVHSGFPKKHLPALLSALYAQAAVSFTLYLDETAENAVPKACQKAANIVYVPRDVFNTALNESRSPFIAFIDEPIFYDRQTLRRMVLAQIENPVDFLCMMPRIPGEGRFVISRVLRQAYAKDIQATEWMLANKLFLRDVLRNAHVELVGDSREDTAFLFRALQHRMMTKPGMLSLLDEDEILSRAENLPLSLRSLRGNRSDREGAEEAAGAGRNFFRHLLGFLREPAPVTGDAADPSDDMDDDERQAEEEHGNSGSSIETRGDMLSYRQRCYLDLDIEEDTVLLQNEARCPAGDLLHILRYLQDQMPDKKLFFVVSEATMEKTRAVLRRERMDRVESVLFESERYVEAAYSSSWIIADDLMPRWWKKKAEQVYLSLLLRTQMLGIGFTAVPPDQSYADHAASDLDLANRVLLPNRYILKRTQEDFALPFDLEEKAVFCGRPGTAQLLNAPLRVRMRERLRLAAEETAVLWMPAAEGRSQYAAFVLQALGDVVSALGKGQILYLDRALLDAAAREDVEDRLAGRVDLRWIPEDMDIYEMMAAADVLISDHSPLLTDFAVTRRKIILYCPDRKKLAHQPGYYLDIRTLPFPYAENAEELAEALAKGIDYDDRDFLMVFNVNDSRENVRKMMQEMQSKA